MKRTLAPAPPRRGRGKKRRTSPAASSIDDDRGTASTRDASSGVAVTPPHQHGDHQHFDGNHGQPRTPAKTPGRAPPRSGATPSTPRAGLRRRVQGASVMSPGDAYPVYRQLVDCGGVGFFQVDRRTWLAELHDVATGEEQRGVHAWTVIRSHAQLVGPPEYTCTPCPDFASHQTCVHTMVVQSPTPPAFQPLVERYGGDCFPIEHYPSSLEGAPTTTFAVSSKNSPPVVVCHSGTSPSSGIWACSKHRSPHCDHIAKCMKLLRDVSDTAFGDPGEEPEDANVAADNEASRARRLRTDLLSRRENMVERSVSYKPVGPPMWCRLPEDETPSYPLCHPMPERIAFDDESLCRCGSGPKADAPVRHWKCTVYTSHRAYDTTIDVKACAVCRGSRMAAGPDLRELGLFNFNNHKVYSHELLNSFTSGITAHELPFHGFVTAVQHAYTEHQSPIPFVSDDSFRSAYFSFRRIQKLGDSFRCELCGPNPRCVIFDGVTAGFNAKHLLPTLSPPTTVTADAPSRGSVRTPIESTSIVWSGPRQRGQKAVRWRLGLTADNKSQVRGIEAEEDDDDDDPAPQGRAVPDADSSGAAAARATATRASKRDALDASMRASLPAIAKELGYVNEALGAMFEVMVLSDFDDEEDMRRPYLELLNHVLAYESALLFVPPPTWLALAQLELGDHRAAEVLLREVPAIGAVATQELEQSGSYSNTLKKLVGFIRERATRVFASLSEHEYEAAVAEQTEDNWMETGTFYGRPQVRVRPEYPHLPGDKKVDRSVVTDSGAGGIGCSKYYEAYGTHGQTGGLMAAWCPHLVCLGFHCIPKGEGRNDVFSALFTRWEKPPEVVIYDFACALAQYCLVREPAFFKNTRFLIDGFHAKGHTRCTQACFISSYKNHPDLTAVNSSAAECGNRGLLKIRRPLSYMSQRHAIIYAYTYLATWNRERRIEAVKKAGGA